jgi:polar amino acid transport system substrate-binding protein
VKTVDRLRDELARASSSADDGAGPAFSVSIGVAEYVEGDDYHSLTARADRHLYRAKAEGRNRVCSAG